MILVALPSDAACCDPLTLVSTRLANLPFYDRQLLAACWRALWFSWTDPLLLRYGLNNAAAPCCVGAALLLSK